MGMEERQGVEQAILPFESQSVDHVASREADIRLGQRHRFRPRRAARGQQDDGIVISRRSRLVEPRVARSRALEAECTEPLAGQRRKIDDRDAERVRDVAAGRARARERQQRRQPKIGEIAAALVGGEFRIERNAHRAGSRRDHRDRVFRTARHQDREPVMAPDTELPQPKNDFAYSCTERAIGERRLAECENGLTPGRRPPVMRDHAFDRREDAALGTAICRCPLDTAADFAEPAGFLRVSVRRAARFMARPGLVSCASWQRLCYASAPQPGVCERASMSRLSACSWGLAAPARLAMRRRCGHDREDRPA